MLQDNTGHEIASQVHAWNDAVRAVTSAVDDITSLWEHGNYDSIVVTGCGSTHYLSMIAAALFQSATRIPSRAVPASEILYHPELVYAGRKPLLVAISRSATTTETIHAVESFRRAYVGDVIVISCYDDKPLNALASLNLTAREGQEVGIAQTRSFSAMLVMVEGLAAQLKDRTYVTSPFPEESEGWVEEARQLASRYADPDRFERVFYLGSGALYGLACEAMLKMKEMSLTSAEAYHTMEFRHGPKSMVDEKTLIIGLLGPQPVDADMAVLREMAALGATTLSVATSAHADIPLTHFSARPSLVHSLPFVQWLAYLRAINKGLRPDSPRHLDQVVVL
jgi:glucosamine--fructose-6-phosphate aminotransferase (isomerizing)